MGAQGAIRAGLAPLELVLALPIMLFVMALIMNMGTVGAWKVRAQVNGRYAAWRPAEARTGQDPNPYGWPAGNIYRNPQPPLTSVVPDWATLPTPPAEQVVRGAVVADPASSRVIVLDRELDMWDGVVQGSATQTRRFPLLQNLLRGGQYRLLAETEFLDNAWEHHSLGFGNASRRAAYWWQIDPEYFTDTSARDLAHQALVAAMAALPDPENPGYLAIDPLDNDPNLIRLPRVFTPPDFHPGMPDIGLYDPNVIRDHPRYQNPNPNDRNALLSRIRRLPGTMGNDFRNRYQSRWNDLEQQRLDAAMGLAPPLTPAESAEMAQLQQWIDQLNDFLNSLPPQHK